MIQLKGLTACSIALMIALSPVALNTANASSPEGIHKDGSSKPGDSRSDHPHPKMRHFRGGHLVKDTADMINMDPKVLKEQLQQGKTLMQIVQASKGWSEEQYLRKLIERATSNIDQAVSEGKLDQEKASRIKAILPNKLKAMIHRTWKDNKPGQPALDYRNNQINWERPDHNGSKPGN